MNTENKAYKVAIYCRLSEEDRFKSNEDDDSNSIINQKSLLMQYCLDKGWEVYNIYSDDNYTGSDRNRPAFNALLKDAEEKKFDIILCKTQSRFTREIEMVEKYINYLLPIWGIRFISVVDNADTEIKGNKKSRQINGLINEWYLEDMSENIKAVLTNRRKNGYFIGAFAPYGYKKDPDNKGHLIIDEEAAETVRLIYSLYISGLGRSAIARELNARHIPTATDYKIAHGERYKNAHTATHNHLWRYFMVANILTSETYKGNLVQNKAHSISYKSKTIKPTNCSEWIKVENTHEPIIDQRTWDLAQQVLNAKIKPTFETRDPNIFSKKVFCAECGRVLKVSRRSNSTSNFRYLKCSTRYYAREECIGVSINYCRLYDEVLKRFQSIINEMLDENETASEIVILDKFDELINHYKAECGKLQMSISDSTKYLKNLYVDKVKGVIDEQTYADLSKTFTAERENNSNRLQQTEQRIVDIQEEAKKSKSKLDIVKQYKNCDKLTFEIIQLFVEKIMIHHTPQYSREMDIEIFWKF